MVGCSAEACSSDPSPESGEGEGDAGAEGEGDAEVEAEGEDAAGAEGEGDAGAEGEDAADAEGGGDAVNEEAGDAADDEDNAEHSTAPLDREETTAPPEALDADTLGANASSPIAAAGQSQCEVESKPDARRH